MRFATMIAAAMATACAAVPAEAAITINVSATAQGATTFSECDQSGCVDTVLPVTQFINRIVSLPDFVNGVASFTDGEYRASGVIIGTVLDLGQGLFAGRDFTFFSSISDGRTCISEPRCFIDRTVLTAATFSVTQFPGDAVPEPATWAMILIGFGAIGASMRCRRRPHHAILSL